LSTKKEHAIIPSDWVSSAEAARIRGVSRQAITKLIEAGRLSVLTIGGRRLVNRHEVTGFHPQKPGRRKQKDLA
jgi:excisionase family DNA binding protein